MKKEDINRQNRQSINPLNQFIVDKLLSLERKMQLEGNLEYTIAYQKVIQNI